MKYKLTFALAASLTSTAFAEFKAPLTEFKNEKQLAEWRAEKSSESASQGYVSEETAFYTGKPYLAASNTYAFKFRSYDFGAARWTSEDPSGFPDGANSNIYAPIPTSQLDWQGLEVKMVFSINSKTLTATDLQTNQTITIAGVLSGDGVSANIAKDDWKRDQGPSPRGNWLVGEQGTNDWYRLYGPNGSGGYSYTSVEVKDPQGNTIIRDGFNLHMGTRSIGCVTVAEASWTALETMLNNTQTFSYNNSQFTARLQVTE